MTLLFLERLRLSTTEASTRPCNGSMTAVSPLQREVPLQRFRVSILRLLRSLTSDCVMAHYNPEAEAELKVDASQVGLGAILMQSILEPSPTLMDGTLRQKEALAVV